MVVFGILFMYLIGAVCTWLILYYTIKTAVKNGILEARSYNETASNKLYKSNSPTLESPTNKGHVDLQKRYDNGEITFETFQEEWNKLNS